MPNWCRNTLLVEGSERDVYRWVERAASFERSDPQPLNFAAFVSPPPDITPRSLWCAANWGTKWEPSMMDFVRKEGSAKYVFDTAWDAPLEWLRRVASQHPEIQFSLSWREPGGGFAGESLFQDGLERSCREVPI